MCRMLCQYPHQKKVVCLHRRCPMNPENSELLLIKVSGKRFQRRENDRQRDESEALMHDEFREVVHEQR